MMAVFSVHLGSNPEIVQAPIPLERDDAQGVSVRLVKGERSPVNRQDSPQGLADSVVKRIFSEIRDDRVVDLKKGAMACLAFSKCLLRPFPFRDVDERDDGTQGSTVPNYRMRPKLHRKAGAVLSPIDLIVSMDALAFLKADVNGALLERVRRAVFPRVVLQCVHVLAEQFGRIVVSEHAHGCTITEKAGTLGIAPKDRLSGGIQYEPDFLLAMVQRLFRLFSLRDVLGERHDEPRHALGARNERNVVPHPDETPILAPILLLDLKLLPFAL